MRYEIVKAFLIRSSSAEDILLLIATDRWLVVALDDRAGRLTAILLSWSSLGCIYLNESRTIYQSISDSELLAGRFAETEEHHSGTFLGHTVPRYSLQDSGRGAIISITLQQHHGSL